MPQPVELGEWSDADALLLPTPSAAPDDNQTQAAFVRLGYSASLQHDVSAIQEAEPESEAQAEPAPGAEVEPPPAAAQEAEEVAAAPEPAAPAEIPPTFEARLALARQLFAQGALRQSLPVFERALELRAHSVDALLGKASALFFLEDFEAAKSSAQQAIAIDPRSHDGFMLIGSSFERLGNGAAAAGIYERCIDQALDNTRCRERLTQLDAKP
jgi:tetratricopeptide (TPR) repeat protein